MNGNDPQFDLAIVGGGPAGSILACLAAEAGHRTILVERDIHPREHVGESLTPSTNSIFERIGFLKKMEEAGFVHKPGACWTAPRSPVGKYVSIRLDEFPLPGTLPRYSYNVERDVFDSMLLRHAHEKGAKVLQGVRVEKVLFEGERAAGLRFSAIDGQPSDISAKVVVDATGRRCLLASQLGLKRKDPDFNQFGMYSWFAGVEPNPPRTEGMIFLHFLGLERAWAWQIPLRNGICSIGVVTDKADFKQARMGNDEYFASLVERSVNLRHNLRHATRVRPWHVEGDYSYKVDTITGKGWLLVGDALRFVDPVFSTGVDVAAYSALYGFDAVHAALEGHDEEAAFDEYARRVGEGVDAWYCLIALFYKLQNLFTFFALKSGHREKVVRVLQGNLYMPESVERAREVISMMEASYQAIMADPSHLLRPGALARLTPDEAPVG